jgi:hypothetical protein
VSAGVPKTVGGGTVRRAASRPSNAPSSIHDRVESTAARRPGINSQSLRGRKPRHPISSPRNTTARMSVVTASSSTPEALTRARLGMLMTPTAAGVARGEV